MADDTNLPLPNANVLGQGIVNAISPDQQMAQQAEQQGSTQGPSAQPQAQAPKMGGQPLLYRYISEMIKGQAGGRPISRGDASLNFMGEFLGNLANGLASAGHGPGANLRGFAGGVQAPYQRSLQDFNVQQQANQQQAQLQGEQARTALTQEQVAMQPELRQAQINALTAQPRFDPQTRQFLGMMNDAQFATYVRGGAAAAANAGAKVQTTEDTNASKERIAGNKPGKTQITDLDIKGVNHKVLVDSESGEVIKDLGLSKIPQSSPGAADTRLDKSYQFNTSQLAAIAKPITERADRMERLKISLAEKSPQADALIAPELLTAMAGGTGSGLRMNEAEISRIVGGRTNLESLKAAVNKWRLDPTKGLSITDAQRQQVYSLINKMGDRIDKKQGILTDAQQKLVDATDVVSHRRILADTKKKLADVDAQGDIPEAAGGGMAEQFLKKYPPKK